MKTQIVRKIFNLFIILIILLSGGGALPVIAQAGMTGNILAHPQAGNVDYVHCEVNAGYVLSVTEGSSNTVVYTSDINYCFIDQGGTPNTVFQIEGYTLKPGDSVTVSDGTSEKNLVITPEGTFTVDPNTDIIQGVNMPNRYLGVWSTHYLGVYAGPDGSWVADFSPYIDLIPGSAIAVYEHDEDGDATAYHRNVPNPHIEVRANTDLIEGREWAIGETLTLWIAGQEVGRKLVEAAPWNPNESYVFFDLRSDYRIDVNAGDLVSLVNDHSSIKSTVVTNLEITAYDLVNDMVWGKAVPGSNVEVWICPPDGCVGRRVAADGEGNWIADFAHPGTQPDEQNLFDIDLGTWIDSYQKDDDSDITRYGVHVLNPYITVYPLDDVVYGYDWPEGVEVTLDLKGESYSTTVAPAPWDPGANVAIFELGGQVDIQPGDVVSMTGAGTTKTITVSRFALTSIDVVNQKVSGVAEPGGQVAVCTNRTGGCGWVTANDSGDWEIPASELGEGFDIQPGDSGWAVETEADGDNINLGWRVPNPMISVNPTADWVYGYEWPEGVEITLYLKGESYTTTMVPTPWDNSGTKVAMFDLFGQVDIQPGDTITMTDGTIAKTVTVTNFAVTRVELGTNTISGTASPNVQIILCSHGTPGNCRTTTAGEDGLWTLPPDPDGFVLQSGDNGWAVEKEPDQDETFVNWEVPILRLEVHPQYDLVHAFGWYQGDLLTLSITDAEGAVLAERTTVVSLAPWDANLPMGDFFLDGFDLLPGQVLTVSGNGYAKVYLIPDPKLVKIDSIADTISGTGTPGAEMLVCANLPDQCVYRWAHVDEYGNWLVSFAPSANPDDSPGSFDLVPASNGWADEFNAEGDQTWAEDWYISTPTHGKAIGLGWYNSPVGALTANPTFGGKAAFTYAVAYDSRSSSLKGSVRIVFKSFVFNSATLDWLVIEDDRMQMAGSGSVNGNGEYAFLINVMKAGTGKGTIGIRVWREDNGTIIYDSMLGAPSNEKPEIVINDGIIIHTQ